MYVYVCMGVVVVKMQRAFGEDSETPVNLRQSVSNRFLVPTSVLVFLKVKPLFVFIHQNGSTKTKKCIQKYVHNNLSNNI